MTWPILHMFYIAPLIGLIQLDEFHWSASTGWSRTSGQEGFATRAGGRCRCSARSAAIRDWLNDLLAVASTTGTGTLSPFDLRT